MKLWMIPLLLLSPSTSSDETSSSSCSSSSGSGSSSSDSSSSGSSGSENEKEAPKPPPKVVRRKSSEITHHQKIPESKPMPILNKNKDRVMSSSATKVMQQKLAKASAYSSDEELPKVSEVKRGHPPGPSRGNIKQNPMVLTGGKAPPSVLKQHQIGSNLTASKQQAMKSNQGNNKGISASALSEITSKASSLSSKTGTTKKKSIFSPENSSESEIETTPAPAKPPNRVPATGKTKPPPKMPINNTNSNKELEQKKAVRSSKSSSDSDESDSSSDDDDDDDDSSDSNSESDFSADNSPPSKKPTAKKNQTTPKKSGKQNSDSEEATVAKNPVRKLTRSSSTRKSKHVLGKAATDSESDDDSTKRSESKSPVKKSVPTKGKSKNVNSKRNDTKVNASLNAVSTPVIEERRCPNDNCNSLGHLNGVFEKHFTLEACPQYHNVSIADTKSAFVERKKREDERKKAMASFDPTKKVVTQEQKNYLQKINDTRSKFKPTATGLNGTLAQISREAEPNLTGFVSDYDLQMFRDAQAMAAENIETELKVYPAGKGTKHISMGKFKMDVWYQSPYPEDAARLPKLYICEFCLRYQKSEVGMKRHAAKCVWRHPPGDEIYRKGKLGVWQVCGKRHKQYCQHLCLLAKFFLDYKTLYYDVEPFLFYVMTLADSEGCHTVGYFSKEKNSFLNYNVSCILTLPPYQRQGYGRLLIDFSYLLTRVEGKIGSPEKPLSDLGLISYRSYWKDVLLDYLCNRNGNQLHVKDLSQEMAINSYDIVSTLQALGMMKYWKGKHIILKKQDVLDDYKERVSRRGAAPKIDPTCLRWTPFTVPAITGSSS